MSEIEQILHTHGDQIGMLLIVTVAALGAVLFIFAVGAHKRKPKS